MSSLPTTTWGTESDANRIKKTYVKGYMDVSGGDLSVHNTAFNVFNSDGNASFRMNPQKITVKDGVGQEVDISLSFLTFLNNLVPPDGVPISIPDKVKYIYTSGTETQVGKTDASSNFRVYGNTYVEQYLFVGLDASFGQKFFLTGDASFNSNLYVKSKSRFGNDLSLNGNFTMYGDASLNGRLMLSGDASFNSNLYVKSKTRLDNDLSLNGNFTMYGDASLNGRLMLSRDASFNSNLYVKSKTSLGNDLSLNGNFTMYGDASLNGRLMLSGDASFNSNLYVKSKTRLDNDLSLNGNFTMYGDASLNGRLMLSGDASFNSNLYVKSKTSLGNDLSLNGNFTMYGDASLNGRLMLSGDASFNSNLYIKSKTSLGNDLSLNGNFTMYGDASLNGRLYVSNDASFNSNLYIKSKTSLGNDLSLNGNFTMYGDASLNGRLMLSGDSSFNSNLYVKSKTRLDNDLSLNGNFTMYGDASLNGRLMLSGDASLNGNLYVNSKTRLSNDLSLNGNFTMYGDASLNGRLMLSGDASFNSNLYVKSKTRLDNDLSLNGNFTIYGDASLNGRLMLSGDASFNSNLYVKSKTRLDNDLSLNGNFTMYGDASLNGRVYVSNDVSFNSNLYVKSKTSLGNDLSLNGNLFVYGGDASLNGRLFVNGDASLNGNMFITSGRKVGIGKIPGAAYSLDVSGSVNIANGVLYINDSVFSSGSASLNGNVKVGSDNGFVTVDKPPFYYDPSMTIFYDFNTISVNNSTSLKNLATGNYDATLNNGASIDNTNYKFADGCLATNTGLQADQYLIIDSNTAFFSSSFSFSVWIKPNTVNPSARQSIFDFANTVSINSNTIALAISTSGFLIPIINDTEITLSTNNTVINNGWNHIVWNVSSQSNVITSTVFLNNMQQGASNILTGTFNIGTRSRAFIANSNRGNSVEDYAGYIDNFRFYSGKTLSYAEVYQLYTGQSYKLDVNGGILANGRTAIFESIGTLPSANKIVGALTLLHGDASGGSSIVFPSVNQFTNDYAYIQYQENVPYPGNTSTESGLFTIGIENDALTALVKDRMCLWSSGGSGHVGINTKNPAYTLDVNGNVNATSYNATSDYRVKTNVMALDGSFNVDVLKPVTYTNTRHGRQDIGFIAHEVQEHYPFLVNGEKDAEQFQSLNYIGLIGILTKEIQDLKRRLAETEAKNTTIIKKMDAQMEQVYSMLTSADNHNQTVNKKIDANMEQVYSMFVSAEAKVASIEENVASIEETVASIEETVASIEETVTSVENAVHSVENTVLSVENAVHSVENAVHSVENTVLSVENTVLSVENTVLSVENTVLSVENTVLLEQARLAICETDVALSKSAIKDLEEKFQS